MKMMMNKISPTFLAVLVIAIVALAYLIISLRNMNFDYEAHLSWGKSSEEGFCGCKQKNKNKIKFIGSNYTQPMFNDDGQWSGYFIDMP